MRGDVVVSDIGGVKGLLELAEGWAVMSPSVADMDLGGEIGGEAVGLSSASGTNGPG